ncbi:PIN domain [Moorella glycerini]|uniref:tRNA(fMet)-specific endonuclease VapC n=1 Tax=Neomoorella stamsii TaxID=1266720 RepID=A0A9X7J2C2_9FIRM|nr:MULTISPECIES: type II toxin-antitoxin system VapC family toxin [Moorella]PRR72153.1 tRNA(fMet)-specific endonuclease VapC [Moorella stamsii]CEP69454.1 PIN domain [Moorella glycerini]
MNGSYHKNFVLDAYAVICYLEDETGADEVALLLKKAGDNTVRLFMTWINLGEVYYRVHRKYGEIEAERVLETVKNWPVEFLAGDEDLTLVAARVKASYALSYADAYAIAAALKNNAAVVTGDPEIKNASVKMGFPLTWLGQGNPE